MSLFSRLLLASIAALLGAMMIAIAPPTDKAAFFYVFGGFCIAIAVACVATGRAAKFFGSVVALGVLLAGAWYTASMLMGGVMVSGRRSAPSLSNSFGFLFVFGVPAALYLWKARFGFGDQRNAPVEDKDAES